MSWLQKLLPPKIKRTGAARQARCPRACGASAPSCDAVLYTTDLEKNASVCPKCGHHNRIGARARLDLFLDPEGRYEIGAEVGPVDTLKFKDIAQVSRAAARRRRRRPARPTRWW